MVYFILLYVIVKTYYILTIYQQAHYDILDYFKHFIINFLYYDLFCLLVLILSMLVDDSFIKILCGIYISLYSLIFIRVKKKIVITNRIIRLFALSILLIIGYCFTFNVSNYILLLFEFTIIPVFVIDYIINIILNYPKIINAKTKLSNYKGKKIIITGSYGKTSTKVLFNQVLSNFYNVSKTPKSYNTLLGISKYVNEININLYDYIVLEYGASKVNDISKLLNLAKPDIGVVTDIGMMHMTTFKNIDNIINEKMKLALASSLVILNYDNTYIREYKIENKIILSFGIEHGDYKAKNIHGNSFDFYYKDKYIEHFDINLSGKHNIYNLLAVLAYCHYNNMDMSVVKMICTNLKMEKNRLEVKQYKNHKIIDDSFNSNINGFKEALSFLKSCDDKRILLTPGIVELGKYKKEVYHELALYIKTSCDIVILVGYNQSKMLYDILKKYLIEIYLVKDFYEGYTLYKSISNYYIRTTLLIENDLPDIYMNRILF